MDQTTVEEAFKTKQDKVLVETRGLVTKVLDDDIEGTPHQRFILTANSGQTVLVLNNLERSYRLPVKDRQHVEVRGQYRWNRHGGLIHETNHDDRTPHQDGWIILTGINKRNSVTSGDYAKNSQLAQNP